MQLSTLGDHGSQCRFVDYNTRAMWWGMLMVEEAVGMLGQEVEGSLCLLLSGSMNLKLP